MSPHNDRCTSGARVSPDQDQPDTAVATFLSSRSVARSSVESIRRVSKAHHRVRAIEITFDREARNHTRTHRVKGNSYPCDTTSHCQYWWRRRYGPAQLAFAVA
jgi:hypothetical protein